MPDDAVSDDEGGLFGSFDCVVFDFNHILSWQYIPNMTEIEK